MKRIVAFSVLMLASAGLFAAGIPIGLGAEASYLPLVHEFQKMEDAAGFPLSYDYNSAAFAARAFVDFTYGIVSIGYRQTNSGEAEGGGTSIPKSSESFSLSQIELRAMGKLPIRLGFVALIPMAGLEYTICLDGKIAGTTFPSYWKNDYSDLSVIGGLGAEFGITAHFFVRPALLVGYNLTSKRSSSYYGTNKSVSTTGFDAEATVAVGYWL